MSFGSGACHQFLFLPLCLIIIVTIFLIMFICIFTRSLESSCHFCSPRNKLNSGVKTECFFFFFSEENFMSCSQQYFAFFTFAAKSLFSLSFNILKCIFNYTVSIFLFLPYILNIL